MKKLLELIFECLSYNLHESDTNDDFQEKTDFEIPVRIKSNESISSLQIVNDNKNIEIFFGLYTKNISNLGVARLCLRIIGAFCRLKMESL